MAFTRDELQAGFRLGHCLIQPSQNRIVRDDAEVHVEPRVMNVLLCLAERAGEVVSRDTLSDQVWGRVVVTDQAVTNCISELRHHLGDDRSTSRVVETIPKRGYRLAAPIELAGREPPTDEPGASATRQKLRWAWPTFGAALLLIAVMLGTAWWRSSSAEPTLASVAVLRFENAAGDDRLDYLGLALPDEIATLLTRSPDLAVRPSGYIEAENPLAEARARRVGHIISGRYYLEDGDRLTVAVEAQHVDQERVIWRARLTAPADDLLVMRGRITERVHQGLLPALGAAADPGRGSTPAYDEAYRLYLHSLAMPKQPKPTQRAIDMLEQAVALDPAFAPAWAALGLRYYDHGTYGPGGERARQQAVAANRKALALDPELISAARQMVTHVTEAGDLEAAHLEARRLVEKFDGSAESHFALAYVHRFGGLLGAAQRHCELALDRDPHDPRLRSCGYAYLYDGKLAGVMDFLTLDEGSYFVQWGTVLYHLRRRDEAAALAVARQAAPDPTRRLMEPCLEGARGPALDAAAQDFVRFWRRHGDPEASYAVAPMLSHCGYPEAALGLLERAVDGNFCAFPALDRDPVWAGLRDHAQFQRVRAEAIACHEQYRRMVEASGHAPSAAEASAG